MQNARAHSIPDAGVAWRREVIAAFQVDHHRNITCYTYAAAAAISRIYADGRERTAKWAQHVIGPTQVSQLCMGITRTMAQN